MSAVAPAVIVNQLRMISSAVDRLALDPTSAEAPGTFGAIALLLRELIADGEVPGRKDTIGNELERLRGMVAATAVAPPAAKADAAPENDVDGPSLAKFINATIAGEGAVEVVEAKTVSRGMSKKTVLVTLKGNTVLPDDIVLRVDRSANNYLGTYVTEEYPILELLWQHGAKIPQPFALEPTGTVIGDTFIIFARATGVPVGGNYVPPPKKDPALGRDVAMRLAQIHAVPVDQWPRPDQAQGDAFIDEEIDEHLADWKAVGEESAIMDAAFDWILANRQRAYGPPVLTHNDYNYNNMLIEDSKVSAVLDWEFGHVGTAAADLGYFYYSAEATSSWEAFLAAYAEAGGTVPSKEQLDFYILWGQLRLAVMGFQAVKSFEEGKFDDVRFGMSRWHRRNGLFRVAELLDRVKAA